MCVKDMPSVALDCINGPATDRKNVDLVLDDRIEAAFAIVELGERDSRKGIESPSAEEEDLDVDDAEQYHQVPRSPECLREGRRDTRYRNPDLSPVRGSGGLPDAHLPKIVHVKGAVMPTRTFGKPVQKLALKRRHEDDTVGGGIKAKLARMLIERKISQEEAGRSGPDDGTDQKNESDEEGQNTQTTTRGRFVRTSMPVLRPVDVASHIQSSTNSKNSFENLKVNGEETVLADESDSSFQRNFANEPVVLLQDVDGQYKVLPQGINNQSQPKEVPNLMLNKVSKDRKICSSEVSSTDVNVPSSLICAPVSSIPESGRATLTSEHFTASRRDVGIIKAEAGEQSARNEFSFLLRPADHLIPTSSTAGLLQYYMLPVIKNSPDSRNSEFCEIQSGSNVDALQRLEQFSLGRRYYSEPVLKKGELVVPKTRLSSWNVEWYGHLYGSLNNVGSNGTPRSSPVSEAGHPLSGFIESLSLQNLSSVQRDSPKLSNSRRQLLKHDVVVNGSKKSQNAEDERTCCTMRNIEAKAANPRRKISAVVDALEMVRGGNFGSLRTIRSLYTRMGSRNVADSSSARLLENTPHSELRIKAESQFSGNVDHEQEYPLDLSRCHRRLSCRPAEPKVGAKSYSSYPQSTEIFPSTEAFPLADLCSNSNSSATVGMQNHVDSCTTHLDVLPAKDATLSSRSEDSTASRLTDFEHARDTDKHPTESSHLSVPNSHLPPKKRKFLLQTSQNCDLSESKTSSSTKSSLPYLWSPSDMKSSAYRITAENCPGQTPGIGRNVSEAESKLLTDVIANDENIPSVVAVRDEDGDLPLHIAVAQGSVDVVQKLLPAMSKVGVSVDSCNNNRQTALHLAVISSQTRMVELLLNASASANICDRKGNTAVHLAVKYKTLPCLKKILDNSRILLDLDARNYEGLTALHIAVQLSQTDAVKSLLIGGANPNALGGTNGRTPLFSAVEANDFVIASTLIQHGSDPYIASYSGCTPLQIATGKSFGEMIDLLEKCGRECSRRVQDGN